MNNEEKYPIKFAILELKERGGWLVGYKDITLGYIVSKCYVVESNIKYLPNGDCKLSHKVVFPFKDIENFKLSLRNNSSDIGEITTPKYDYYGDPYPVDIVSDIFDNYEDANKQATVKNEKMMEKLILEVPSSIDKSTFKKDYENLKSKFAEQLSICQLFEKIIELETKNMNISKDNNMSFQLLKK